MSMKNLSTQIIIAISSLVRYFLGTSKANSVMPINSIQDHYRIKKISILYEVGLLITTNFKVSDVNPFKFSRG